MTPDLHTFLRDLGLALPRPALSDDARRAVLNGRSESRDRRPPHWK